MNEEIKSNYYAIIPATVRYDKELKPAEKLLYGEITSLANKRGYCFAQNRYFADLYDVTIGTVSKWISHLQKLGYILIIIERNDRNEILSRKIYITDIPYCQKRPYPYNQKELYPMVKNDIYNNININMIEDIFNLIMKKSKKIASDFYEVLDKLGLLYNEYSITIIPDEKLPMIKEITYIIYDLYNSSFRTIVKLFDRKTIFNIYLICKDVQMKKENTEDKIQDFLLYYRKCLINQYSNNL